MATPSRQQNVASRLAGPAWGDMQPPGAPAEQWSMKSTSLMSSVTHSPAVPRDKVKRALLIFCPYGTPERATLGTPPERNSRPSTSWIDERITEVSGIPEVEEPVTDVQRMHKSLLEDQGYAEADIHILAPPLGCRTTTRLPTRQNIVQELFWLTTALQTGDELFFYYAGETLPPPPPRTRGSTLRGSSLAIASMALDAVNKVAVSMGSQSIRGVFSRRPSRNSDAGMARVSQSPPAPVLATHALLPCDSRTAGVVSSEQLHHLLISPLPAGVELICLLDASHSDGLVKMPYIGQPTYVNGTEYYKTGVYKDLERAKAVEGASAAHVFVMSSSSGLVHHLASADPAHGTAHPFLALTEAYIQATRTLLRSGPFDQAHLLTALGAVMRSWACEVATETVMHTTHRGLELPGHCATSASPSLPTPVAAATERDGNSSDECGTEEFPCAQHSVSSDGSGRGLSSTLLLSPARASWTRMTPFSEDEDEGLQSVSDDDRDDGCADMLVENVYVDEHGAADAVSVFLPGSQPSLTSREAPRLSNNPTFQSSSRPCTPSVHLSQQPAMRASTQRSMIVPPSPRQLGPPVTWLASEMRKSHSMPHSTTKQQTYPTTSKPSTPAHSPSVSRRTMNQVQPLPVPAPAPVISRAQVANLLPPPSALPSRPHVNLSTSSKAASFAAVVRAGDMTPATVRAPCVVRVFDPASLLASKQGSKMGFILNGELPWQLASQWVAMPIITSSWLVDLNQK